MILMIHNETSWVIEYIQFLISREIKFVDLTWRQVVYSTSIEHACDRGVIWKTPVGDVDFSKVSGILHEDRFTIEQLCYASPEDKHYWASAWHSYFHGILDYHKNVLNPIDHLAPNWTGYCESSLREIFYQSGFIKWSSFHLLKKPFRKFRVFQIDHHFLLVDQVQNTALAMKPVLLSQLQLMRESVNCRIMTLDIIACGGKYCVLKIYTRLVIENNSPYKRTLYRKLTHTLLGQSRSCSIAFPKLYIDCSERPNV